MKPKTNHYSWLVLSLLGGTLMLTSCSSKQAAPEKEKTLTTVGNPYLPLWEHIPDGEPYVFEDPDQPGKYRVYIYMVRTTVASPTIADANRWYGRHRLTV